MLADFLSQFDNSYVNKKEHKIILKGANKCAFPNGKVKIIENDIEFIFKERYLLFKPGKGRRYKTKWEDLFYEMRGPYFFLYLKKRKKTFLIFREKTLY